MFQLSALRLSLCLCRPAGDWGLGPLMKPKMASDPFWGFIGGPFFRILQDPQKSAPLISTPRMVSPNSFHKNFSQRPTSAHPRSAAVAPPGPCPIWDLLGPAGTCPVKGPTDPHPTYQGTIFLPDHTSLWLFQPIESWPCWRNTVSQGATRQCHFSNTENMMKIWQFRGQNHFGPKFQGM